MLGLCIHPDADTRRTLVLRTPAQMESPSGCVPSPRRDREFSGGSGARRKLKHFSSRSTTFHSNSCRTLQPPRAKHHGLDPHHYN